MTSLENAYTNALAKGLDWSTEFPLEDFEQLMRDYQTYSTPGRLEVPDPAPERRGANFPYNLLGARAELHFQPKGVVGNIVPWNFPVGAMFAPMAGALAA